MSKPTIERFVAALLALLPAIASAGTPDCAFVDGFEAPTNSCAFSRGCPVPVPNPAAALQIDAARQLPDGAANAAITGALVTYLTPAIGGDPAGFFVQASQPGPALFVAVDPATLVPAPEAGDVVDLRVTQLATTASQRRATAVSSWNVTGSGGRVDCLVQDVTATSDLVSNLNSYESEVVRVGGVVTGPFQPAGAGFEAAAIDTMGVIGSSSLRLRMPTAVRDAIDVVAGCAFVVDAAPLWRNNLVAQPSAWQMEDLDLAGCPAPVVAGALATSANSVRVDFSRRIAPASVSAGGNQFVFDQGLAATSATADGRSVLLGTTPQGIGTNYVVTVAGTVTDLQGTPLANPNSAAFSGFAVRAAVRINELNANIANGCDLVELRVTSGGTMQGIRLRERTVDVLSFGPFNVQVNDVVVVHFNGGSATCNPGGATSETTGASQQPTASFPFNYDTAFDWHIPDAGITNTDNVLTLYAADGSIMDAVFVSDDPTGTAAADTETQAAAVALAGQWQLVGGGVPPGGFVDDQFNANAVQDLNGTSVDRNGLTIQRTNNTDSNDVQHWGMATTTFGLPNAGQPPFGPG